MLVRSVTKLGFIWVLMGSLGGLEALGLLGLFVGPVVLAMAGALWDEWTKRSRNRSVAQP
jgi:predicted PurR-regulated permease PerM